MGWDRKFSEPMPEATVTRRRKRTNKRLMTKAELREMLAQAVRDTQSEAKRLTKAKRDRSEKALTRI
jgi:hypothetical protein